MKKILIVICFLTYWLCASAQSLREVWIEMPDSILPYLNRSQRMELVDYVEAKSKPVVLNAFGDTVRIEVKTLEIKLLDDNTLALNQTWKAPAAESELKLFNLKWQPKETIVLYNENISKPDSLSDIAFNDLKSLMRPRLKEYSLSVDKNFLLVKWNYPLLSKKDVNQVVDLLKPQLLKWTGKDFR